MDSYLKIQAHKEQRTVYLAKLFFKCTQEYVDPEAYASPRNILNVILINFNTSLNSFWTDQWEAT